MNNKNQTRNIDPQKTRAEKLNGRFALVGVIALVGAYITTGQIVPGIIQNSLDQDHHESQLVGYKLTFFNEDI